MIVHHFELGVSFVQTNLIIPLESDIYRTCTSFRHSFYLLVKLSIEESGLISQVTAQTEKHQLIIPVLFFVNCKHDSVWVAQFTIGINSVENTGKSFREVSKIKSESSVNGAFLLISVH